MAGFAGAAKGLASVIGGALGNDKAKDSSAPKVAKSKQSANDSGGEAVEALGYKKGGKVRRTGLAKVHKGERVLTAKQARKYERKKERK